MNIISLSFDNRVIKDGHIFPSRHIMLPGHVVLLGLGQGNVQTKQQR